MASLTARAENKGELADLIRSARERAGLTQTELATRLRTTQSVISRLESGRDEPRLSTLGRLLRTCGFALTIAAAPDDVDRAQIRQHLAMTPAQRLAAARNVNRFVTAAREARRGTAARS